MNYIKPRYLTKDFIRKKAEEFREKYVNPPNLVPVPIIEIVETVIKIYPIPINGLKSKVDMDGFLSRDLKNIIIDHDFYMDQRFENRLRFTYAHEIGHLILHKDEIKQCQFRTEDEWTHFREDMPEDDLGYFEYQAYEFAGRLLVPLTKLVEELEKRKDKIAQFKSIYGDEGKDLLIKTVSKSICLTFGVSEDVIAKRILYENLRETKF